MADSQLVTKNEVKKATVIGTTCISAYLVNYYLRHILSVLTPKMLETESFTVEHIALLSSTYMLFYAAGQLVNGFLGDFVSPKKMVFFGVFIAGLSTVSFPFMPFEFLQIVCFAVFGFALSMTRGPFMKIISENTRPSHARLICVFFSFAGFAGPVIASFIAMINNWKWVFIVAGGIAVVVAFVVYAVMSAMEAKNMLKYKIVKGNGISSLLSVFKIENFIFYMVIACLIEVSYSSISQWIPTLLITGLGFDKNVSNSLYSVISAMRAFMPFVTLAIFKWMKEKDIAMMRLMFFIATGMFALMIFAPNRWLSIAFFAVALMAMSCVSALLWSIYIPGLGKTGKVSSVNGVLDCSGYVAAAVANLLFASVMKNASWNMVYILWAAMGIIGIVATFFVSSKKKSEN